MPTVLVTGANRGLGLEFARQYAAGGWRVHACCRAPDRANDLKGVVKGARERVFVHELDVLSHGNIDALAHHLRDEKIDVLLNNAGLYGPDKQTLSAMDYAGWLRTLQTNVLAPFHLAQAFVEQVAGSGQKKIIAITSRMGSIGEASGGAYAYRSSKAALNMVMKGLSQDLKRRHVIAVVLHPGWVRTDMGGSNAPLAPRDSVANMRAVIERLGPDDSGRWFNHDGSAIPW